MKFRSGVEWNNFKCSEFEMRVKSCGLARKFSYATYTRRKVACSRIYKCALDFSWALTLLDMLQWTVIFSRFLDDRLFATCSDDSTVALYDTRNLKTKIRTLRGHSNWVKNIEYSKRDCLLVTSGFDGSIFTWDLNSYTETNLTYQKVFHTPGELFWSFQNFQDFSSLLRLFKNFQVFFKIFKFFNDFFH